VSAKVGVGEGTVGVTVGVFVSVAVNVGLINVGVDVYVFVGGKTVEVGCSVDGGRVGKTVIVSVGMGITIVCGTSIPVSKRAVTQIPMMNPIERYLISDRMIKNWSVSR
jgi:hypothetical protein